MSSPKKITANKNNAKRSSGPKTDLGKQCSKRNAIKHADLCLVRQVLQHLSNAEIQAVLENISHYKYALITEHLPKLPKSFNRDKPHGPDMRASFGSGVYLEKPPFSRDITVAWEDELDQDSLMRTVLITS